MSIFKGIRDKTLFYTTQRTQYTPSLYLDTSSIHPTMAGKIDINNDIYKLSARPFILEREGDYDRAIKAYQNAIQILDMSIEKFKKMKAPRLNRKMFERQVQIHRDRLAYLQTLKLKGSFDDVVRPPTVLDAIDCLARNDGDSSPWTLSQVSRLHY